MKRVDFKTERTLTPALTSPLHEPKLSTLVRARALGGPRDGAYIEAQHTWDGLVRQGESNKPYPGHYALKGGRWIWKKGGKDVSGHDAG